MPAGRYIDGFNVSSSCPFLQDEPFRIEFCNPEKKFYPGEIIEGRIIFLWNRSCWKIIQGILVKLLCEGEIHYGRSGLSNTLFENTYLCKSYYVFGDGIHDFHVQSGLAAFPFMFTLPNNGSLPQSFIGPFGSITYSIEATAKNNRIYSDADCSTASTRETFIVNEYLNLNTSIQREILAGPIAVTFEKTKNHYSTFSLLGGSRKKNDIRVTLKLAKRGFVPGEFIQFGIIVENQSRKNLPCINIEFQQIVKFIAQTVNTDVRMIGRAAGPSIGPTFTSTWESSIEVPELPVTSPSNSISCINISYILKIEIETGPMSRNLRYEYPIIIGTIPFEHMPRRVRSLEYRRRIPHTDQRHSNCQDRSDNSSTDCPNYLDLAIGGEVVSTPPPTYEDATTQRFFF